MPYSNKWLVGLLGPLAVGALVLTACGGAANAPMTAHVGAAASSQTPTPIAIEAEHNATVRTPVEAMAEAHTTSIAPQVDLKPLSGAEGSPQLKGFLECVKADIARQGEVEKKFSPTWYQDSQKALDAALDAAGIVGNVEAAKRLLILKLGTFSLPWAIGIVEDCASRFSAARIGPSGASVRRYS